MFYCVHKATDQSDNNGRCNKCDVVMPLLDGRADLHLRQGLIYFPPSSSIQSNVLIYFVYGIDSYLLDIELNQRGPCERFASPITSPMMCIYSIAMLSWDRSQSSSLRSSMH